METIIEFDLYGKWHKLDLTRRGGKSIKKGGSLVCNVCSFALFALLSFHARGKPKSPSMLFIESTGFDSSQKNFLQVNNNNMLLLETTLPESYCFFTALASKCGSICGIATALVQNLHVKVEQ